LRPHFSLKHFRKPQKTHETFPLAPVFAGNLALFLEKIVSSQKNHGFKKILEKNFRTKCSKAGICPKPLKA